MILFRLTLYPNTGALLLLAGGAVPLVTDLSFGSPWFWIPGASLVVFYFKYIFPVYQTIPEKRKAIETLYRRNRERFQPTSFQKYMNAPCTREVVKITLKRLDRINEYPELKKRYQTSFFADTRSRTRITFYKDGEVVEVHES